MDMSRSVSKQTLNITGNMRYFYFKVIREKIRGIQDHARVFILMILSTID